MTRNYQRTQDTGPSVPRLYLGEVHVWLVPVAATMPAIDLLAGLLDSTEQDRAESFKHSRDRNRYVAAHGVLRWLLGAYGGGDPRAVRFRNSQGGKPGRSAYPRSRLEFNLSHDGDLALIGLTRFARVGVDVQSHATPVRIDRVAEVALSSDEHAGLVEHEPKNHRDHVLRLWARKEAAVKAVGSGLAVRLDQIEVGGQSPVSISAPGRRFGFSLIIQDLDVGRGYGAAVATPRWCRQIVYRTWMPRGDGSLIKPKPHQTKQASPT